MEEPDLKLKQALKNAKEFFDTRDYTTAKKYPLFYSGSSHK